MIQLQSSVEPTILAFRPRSPAMWTLSARDRLDLAQAHDFLLNGGYHIVLYEREAGDSPEVGSFLSIYRGGEPWALWSMARRGAKLLVWCGSSCADIGTFPSVPEALHALLPNCVFETAANDPAALGLLIRLCGA